MGDLNISATRRETGLTAVELAIVLVVMVIGFLVVVPTMGNLLDLNRQQGAVYQVASGLALARQYAVSTGATYDVTLTTTTMAVACGVGCPAGAPSEPVTTVLHGATLTGPATISFDPTGGAAAPATVTVAHDAVPDQNVCVDTPGRVFVQIPGAPCP